MYGFVSQHACLVTCLQTKPSPAPLVTQKRHEVATVLFSFQFVILEQALEEGFGEKNAFSF